MAGTTVYSISGGTRSLVATGPRTVTFEVSDSGSLQLFLGGSDVDETNGIHLQYVVSINGQPGMLFVLGDNTQSLYVFAQGSSSNTAKITALKYQ